MTAEILRGVRVIEACEVWAGPMAGSLLGDLGADVIKVESYPRSSMTRPVGIGGQAVGPGEGPTYERSAIHHMANRNKRNIALNLRSEEGIEVFHRLLRTADVAFEGYSAGTVDRMGFGWDVVHEINPRLTMISMPGWGAQGPYQGYVTLGSGLDAAVGHAALRGSPNRPLEEVQPIFHSDATGALTLVFAAITALRRRDETGEGSHVDLSQIEAFSWHLAGQLAEWTTNGRMPERLGNRDPYVVPHGCYRAGGGEAGDPSWVVLSAESDAEWSALARAAGHPEWATDAHPWSTLTGRLADRDAIDTALSAFAATDTAEAVADAVQRAGAIAAPAIAPWSVLSSPQHESRGWLQSVTHPCTGAQLYPGFLWRGEPDPPTWDRPCGLVGEHNRDVLEELGYSAEMIEKLQAAGVIGDRYAPPEPPALP